MRLWSGRQSKPSYLDNFRVQPAGISCEIITDILQNILIILRKAQLVRIFNYKINILMCVERCQMTKILIVEDEAVDIQPNPDETQ